MHGVAEPITRCLGKRRALPPALCNVLSFTPT
ncbi:hypothetical protein POX_c03620 [Penicillium oxalicum]|nr:hypothetical protein POX_c03620 [Penicillium oxalicum]KAI2790771.1 hypothetical protein POX_c03620 [Penicillium oxalicum]